ncbi:MAG TPA: 4-hydroxy-tetrahydrodipicolinate synthase [Armatimonadetes bacterium]|nr:4-hydroxy-tetrahydrodipicolinate synthase [Armatimonadota bacterium]
MPVALEYEQTMWGPMMTAMVTPFDDRGNIDLPGVRRLVDHLIDTGTTGLVCCGTTGELPTLDHDEMFDLVSATVDAAAGRVPVVSGGGNNDTRDSLRMTREMTARGVDGIMLVCPYYNRPGQDGLYAHFRTVAEATDKPVMLYNIEARSARNIEPATVARLAADVPNIVALKEASGKIDQFARMAQVVPAGFSIYSGNDGDTPAVLAAGGVGVVSVASHVAGRVLRRIMDGFLAGDYAATTPVYLRFMRLVAALFPASSPNPAPVKAALELIGLPCGGLRLPLTPSGPAERDALAAALSELELIPT